MVAALIVAATSGCATTSRVTELEARVVKLERDRNALALRYERDQKRMQRLRT